MDIKDYWTQVRNIEAQLAGDKATITKYPDGRISLVEGGRTEFVVISLATDDGGIAGRYNDCARLRTARLIVENRARIANPIEEAAFYAERDAKRKTAERAQLARQVTVVVQNQAAESLASPAAVVK